MSDSSRQHKVILIVGASSGFGALAAKRLLGLGHAVYAGARRVDRMSELETLGARLLALDVTKIDTILAGVDRMIREQGRIDVVFANAGFGSYGAIESIPMADVQHQYDVNVFGVARTLKAILPQMRRQRSGRIIITSSIVSHISTAGLGWYASTKHAIKAVAVALRQEVRDLGIHVVLIEPGAVRTEFDTVAFGTLDRVEHPSDYKRLIEGFRQALSDTYAKSPGPESTAEAMVRAATTRKPKTSYRTTSDAKILPWIRALISDRLFDRVLLSQIYKAVDK